MTPTELFTYLHFANIRKQILNGPDQSIRKRLNYKNIPSWDLNAYHKKVMEDVAIDRRILNAINVFFGLCADCAKIETYDPKQKRQTKPFQEVGTYVEKLRNIGCTFSPIYATRQSFVDVNIHNDQVIKFLMTCFGYNNVNNFNVRNNEYNASILQEFSVTYMLLDCLRSDRNNFAHSANATPGTREHDELIERMLCIIYDYITITFFMMYYRKPTYQLNPNCGQNGMLPVFNCESYLRNSVQVKVVVKDNQEHFPDNNIKIYHSNSQRCIPCINGSFTLDYFEKYKIGLNNTCSEDFYVDESFTQGSTLVIGVPPGAVECQKPNILDIVDISYLSEEIIILNERIQSALGDITDNSAFYDTLRTIIRCCCIPGQDSKEIIRQNLDSITEYVKNNKQPSGIQQDKACENIKTLALQLRDDISANSKREEFDSLCHKIDAIFTEIEYQKGKAISEELADKLKDTVQQILNESLFNTKNGSAMLKRADSQLLKVGLALRNFSEGKLNVKAFESLNDFIDNSHPSDKEHVYVSVSEIARALPVLKNEYLDERVMHLNSDGERKDYNLGLCLFNLMIECVCSQSYTELCAFSSNYGNFILSSLRDALWMIFRDRTKTDELLKPLSQKFKDLKSQKCEFEIDLKDFSNDNWDVMLGNVVDQLSALSCESNDIILTVLDLFKKIQNFENKDKYSILHFMGSPILRNLKEVRMTTDIEYQKVLSGLDALIEEIDAAYVKASFGKDCEETELFTNFCIDLLKGKSIVLPEFVNEVIESEPTKIETELKLILLCLAVEYSNINDWVMLYMMFNEIYDRKARISPNSYIFELASRHLIDVFNPDALVWINKNCPTDYQKTIQIILNFAASELQLSLAYTANFDENGNPKVNALDTDKFLSFGYVKPIDLMKVMDKDRSSIIRELLHMKFRYDRLVSWMNDNSMKIDINIFVKNIRASFEKFLREACGQSATESSVIEGSMSDFRKYVENLNFSLAIK